MYNILYSMGPHGTLWGPIWDPMGPMGAHSLTYL